MEKNQTRTIWIIYEIRKYYKIDSDAELTAGNYKLWSSKRDVSQTAQIHQQMTISSWFPPSGYDGLILKDWKNDSYTLKF